MLQKILISFSFAISLFAFASSPAAADMRTARLAFQAGDCTTAYFVAEPLALKGNQEAQGMMGFLYFFGRGVPSDPYESLRWLRLANKPRMTKRLIDTLERDFKLPDDQQAIVRFYELSANLGAPPAALYRFGYLLERGILVPRSLPRAAEFYLKASDHGYTPAKARLAGLYIQGKGVRKHAAMGAKFAQEAAKSGRLEHQHLYATVLDFGLGVPKDRKTALEWYRKSAQGGFAQAMMRVAVAYFSGELGERDYVEALKWAASAANFLTSEKHREPVMQIITYAKTQLTTDDYERGLSLAKSFIAELPACNHVP